MAPPSQPGRSTNRLAVESNLQQKIVEGHAYPPRTKNMITELTGLEHENLASGNIQTLNSMYLTVQRYPERFIWERLIIAHHLLSAVSTAVASRQSDRVKEDLVLGHVLFRVSFFHSIGAEERTQLIHFPPQPAIFWRKLWIRGLSLKVRRTVIIARQQNVALKSKIKQPCRERKGANRNRHKC